MAVGGFLAGYADATRTSYATDLRIFATWCRQADLNLLTVERSHLELFGRTWARLETTPWPRRWH